MTIASALLFLAVLSIGPILLLQLANTGRNHHPDEPPLAPQSIPLIGHLVGLTRKKFEYYVQLSRTATSPIFTLLLPGQKIYIIKSPKLIQAVQKQYKTIAFGPIRAKFAVKICGSSAEAVDIVNVNILQDQGEWGLDYETSVMYHEGLKPGSNLDVMNRTMLGEVARALDGIELERAGRPTRLMLVAWLREILTAATTEAVYGPENPYRDPEVVKAYWDFENRMMSFVTGLANKFTAPTAIAGREKAIRAFEQYFSSDDAIASASPFFQSRHANNLKHKLSLNDIARFEVGGSSALLVNTIPAAFWTLFLIYTAPDLLADIRAEIDAATRTSHTAAGVPVRSLDITTLKSNCPLLLSTFQEVLRYRSMGTSVREVVEDTVLDGDGRWLLKKGAMVQMPSRVVHCDASLWGDDVDEFKPRRFMKGEKHMTASGSRPGDVCFRAFGGGRTLCPGRHFATNEVVAVVAGFVARFDLRPLASGGKWVVPTCWGSNVASVVMEPDWDVEVEVLERTGLEGNTQWTLGLKGGEEGVVTMVVEDMANGEAV